MTPKKTYLVELARQERRQLSGLVRTGEAPACKRGHPEILLTADTGSRGCNWTDARIAEPLEVGTATTDRLHKRFVMEGLEAALSRHKADRVRSRRGFIFTMRGARVAIRGKKNTKKSKKYLKIRRDRLLFGLAAQLGFRG